jgi:hypothetical protein
MGLGGAPYPSSPQLQITYHHPYPFSPRPGCQPSAVSFWLLPLPRFVFRYLPTPTLYPLLPSPCPYDQLAIYLPCLTTNNDSRQLPLETGSGCLFSFLR